MFKNIFSFLLSTSLLFSGCSLKLTRTVSSTPIIRVNNNGTIVHLDLENYVASVLAGEVHASWPEEALKAQAIAARTYALLRMKERKDQPFHVQNSVLDQVYKPNVSDSLTKAARATFGLVLTHGNKLAEASFHSTCGGHTTNSESVWGRPYEYLHGVSCDYCRPFKTFSWQEELSLVDLETKFKQKINKISVLKRSADGRVLSLELSGDKNRRLSGHELRMAIGPMKIKSTLIEAISINGSKVTMKGKGFGHGVGLCQYGALGMAKNGKRFNEILSHYYPGTKLSAMY